MMKLKEAKEQYGFKQVWIINGKILFNEDDSPSTNPRHFIFVSIVLYNFYGYALFKNCFEFSFDIFIYK